MNKHAILIVDAPAEWLDLKGINPPCYVKAYAPSGGDGNGYLVVTEDRDEALSFDSTEDMTELWRAVSTTHPTRFDGRPNRPLTAFTVEFVQWKD